MTTLKHEVEREAFERWYAQFDDEHFGVYEDPDEPGSWIYLERDVASAWSAWQARAALSARSPEAQGENAAPAEPAGPPWHFRRFVDGQEMAEDIQIERETTLEGAIKAAMRLCPPRPCTVLVATPPAAIPGAPTCVCGQPSTPGVTHRKDGPCFHEDTHQDFNPASPVHVSEPQLWAVVEELREAAREAMARDPAAGVMPDADHAAVLEDWANRLEASAQAFHEDIYAQCAEAIKPAVDAGLLPASVVEAVQQMVKRLAAPTTLTPEEHQVLRSAVRDSAEVVAPGRMEEPAHPAWCSCGACNPETARTGRELDLYDEIECDLPYLFGRASLEGHESGQRLAKAVREKMQRARLSTPPTPEAEPAKECDKPPIGWRCTRGFGHEGPCAAEHVGGTTKEWCAAHPGSAAFIINRLAQRIDEMEAEPAQQDTKRPRHPVGAADCYPDDKGCCGCTVTARCPGCPYATPPAQKQAAPTWTADQVEQVEKEAMEMLGKLQASPQAPRDDLGVALFCDLKTDEEKYNFFLFGRGYETGVIAHALQNDVAMAYKRCAEYRKLLASMQAAPSGEGEA